MSVFPWRNASTTDLARCASCTPARGQWPLPREPHRLDARIVAARSQDGNLAPGGEFPHLSPELPVAMSVWPGGQRQDQWQLVKLSSSLAAGSGAWR
jgi:hypothetical protein